MSNEHPTNPTEVTRRAFIVSTGGAAAAIMGNTSMAQADRGHSPSATTDHIDYGVGGKLPVKLHINGQEHSLTVDPRTSLLDCLRETVGLTGTKKGCDHGQCGACTVHVNGNRVLSCLSLAIVVDGSEIKTVEGLGTPEDMHPMQAAFVECDAYQCGYCTSGQIMSAVALLDEPCGSDDAAVKELMSGNICRCGAYANIVAAIQQVRKNLKAD